MPVCCEFPRFHGVFRRRCFGERCREPGRDLAARGCAIYRVVVATGLAPDPLMGHGHAGGVRKRPVEPYGPVLLAITTANGEGIGCFSLHVTIKMCLDCDGSS